MDEHGDVVFDFQHDELKNPGHCAFKMAKLLVMMHEGELHHLVVDGIRNRALKGDQVAGLILEHYGAMYSHDSPCVGPKEIFDINKVRDVV